MGFRYILALMVVAFNSPLTIFAAPPKVPGTKLVGVGEVFEVEIEEDEKGPVILDNPYPTSKLFIRQAIPTRAKTVAYIIQAKEAGNYRFTLWTKGDTTTDKLPVVYYDFIVGTPPTPPIPPTPDPPKPPEPKPPIPTPKGFRVIYVYESSQALTPAMQQVMFGEKVRNYLDTKTAKFGTTAGYRRWDKDVDAKNEKDPDIKALWESARPQVSTIPCIIIAVDGKAEIINYPESEEKALETFKKYGGN